MEFDKKQVEMGMDVEKEHAPTVERIRESLSENLDIPDKEIFRMIAEDHLREMPDYYTRLKRMEEEGKGEKKAALRRRGYGDDADARKNTDELYSRLGGETMVIIRDKGSFEKAGDLLTFSSGGVVPEYISDSGSYAAMIHEAGDPDSWEAVGLQLDEDAYMNQKREGPVGEDQWQLYFLLQELERGAYRFVENHDRNVRWLKRFIEDIDYEEEEEDYDEDEDEDAVEGSLRRRAEEAGRIDPQGLRKAGGGKFDYVLDELVYAMSLDGGPDEQVGDAQGPTGWAGLMRGLTVQEFEERAAELGAGQLTEGEKALIEAKPSAIIMENDQGFVAVDFLTADEAEKEWAALEAEDEELRGEEELGEWAEGRIAGCARGREPSGSR